MMLVILATITVDSLTLNKVTLFEWLPFHLTKATVKVISLLIVGIIVHDAIYGLAVNSGYVLTLNSFVSLTVGPVTNENMIAM